MRTYKYGGLTANYRSINIVLPIPWKAQWRRSGSAVSSKVHVDNGYSVYNPEEEGCVWVPFLIVNDIFAKNNDYRAFSNCQSIT